MAMLLCGWEGNRGAGRK